MASSSNSVPDKYLTYSEVSQYNSKETGIYVILKGVVYDVSNFAKDHPGSEETILDFAGKDLTKDYNEVGHSSTAHTNGTPVGYVIQDPVPKKNLWTVLSPFYLSIPLAITSFYSIYRLAQDYMEKNKL